MKTLWKKIIDWLNSESIYNDWVDNFEFIFHHKQWNQKLKDEVTQNFDKTVKEFEEEYKRKPTQEELKKILNIKYKIINEYENKKSIPS